MGDFFGGLRSGIQFPQVVMNQGPLPGSGGLPAPLHETADARINYGSSLLGDLTPYAYGEPGYLSSQNAYLNIPHKIQKIVPVVYLPEAKPGAKDFFDLSHPIDDGDLAFVLRLDRNSLFCTGLKNGDMRRAGLGTAVDPLINLCTLNYILSGLQLGINGSSEPGNLWTELFHNLDKQRFGKSVGVGTRNYEENPIGLDDVMHVVRNCIRPFGITRGSEKQGGQDEATISPATWPVSFVVSLTIDGKESNVLNIWHYHELHAGNDLILRLKLMPLRQYTLNHYYKGVKRQNWDMPAKYVWQLVPDIFHLERPTKDDVEEFDRIMPTFADFTDLEDGGVYKPMLRVQQTYNDSRNHVTKRHDMINSQFAWQELGFWHIGRSQIMTGKYGMEEYWHNDLANCLKTNHLDITLQPMFQQLPRVTRHAPGRPSHVTRLTASAGRSKAPAAAAWTPRLGLERLAAQPEQRVQRRRIVLQAGQEEADMPCPGLGASTLLHAPSSALPVDEQPAAAQAAAAAPAPPVPHARAEERLGEAAPAPLAAADEEPEWLGRLEFTDSVPAPQASDPVLPTLGAGGKKGGKVAASKRGRPIGGSLLKADGTSEASMVGML